MLQRFRGTSGRESVQDTARGHHAAREVVEAVVAAVARRRSAARNIPVIFGVSIQK